MHKESLEPVVRRIRTLAGAAPESGQTDEALLQRFAADWDEAAFAEVVRRHGGLVLGVCRHVLHNAADAEDAFQATFLVLSRKAAAAARLRSVAGWLHGVAYRTALNARKVAMRRRKHEHQAGTGMRSSDAPDRSADLRELQAVLDEAVQQLPEKYRAPFVLCCLEGLSRTQAARELNCKEGTVASRVAKARELLQKRLNARGITLPAALAAYAVASSSASAATATSATQGALAFAAGRSADAGSPQVVMLAEEVLRGLAASRTRAVVLWAATCSLLLTGLGLTACARMGAEKKPGDRPEPVTPAAPRGQDVPPDRPKLDPPKGPPEPAVADARDLYGETGGEETLPADKALASVPLRARKGDTFFKLSNAKVEPIGRNPFPVLSVDYEKLTEGPYNGVALVVQRAEGRAQTYLLIRPFGERKGKIEISLGIAPPGQPGPPKTAELYLTRGEHRYGGDFRPNFKVSTSAMIGEMKEKTLAREWKPEEIARLRIPPPEGPKANANPAVGQDTRFAGDSGGGNFRYAESGKPVIGVEYWTGAWDKEPCLARLIPVYTPEQPVEGAGQRVMAKPGYAVGALTVRTKRHVNAVQITFMKLSDGKLDPKDSYTSEWLGATDVAGKEIKLGGDGRAVIGLNCRQGGILNAVALVIENKSGK
jgi:RNA polymerase sigma factor (sigma-70 family)